MFVRKEVFVVEREDYTGRIGLFHSSYTARTQGMI
jgi:hypothetical protein